MDLESPYGNDERWSIEDLSDEEKEFALGLGCYLGIIFYSYPDPGND